MLSVDPSIIARFIYITGYPIVKATINFIFSIFAITVTITKVQFRYPSIMNGVANGAVDALVSTIDTIFFVRMIYTMIIAVTNSS